VLSSDVARLEQSQRVASLRLQRLDAQVSLIQALGGGYTATDDLAVAARDAKSP
jgi:hypothetical protein